jgi:hypothetical protein
MLGGVATHRVEIAYLLYCTVLYCTVLYCTVLYCTVLYCTVLYCAVLYCRYDWALTEPDMRALGDAKEPDAPTGGGKDGGPCLFCHD